jgi:cobalt-precorrin-5B (C1)-methyltransferase
MKRTYGYDLERSVKCSNFIGQTIDMVKELGFSKMLLTGHIGIWKEVSSVDGS